MDLMLLPKTFDLAQYHFGEPQQSGAMTIVPIFGADNSETFGGPLSSLKLSKVRGYGSMELSNPATKGVTIVPLHMGYIQDQAQNHALCRSAFLAAGQTLMFEDACCVQAAQGGYLEGRDQWFFILPLQLRAQALELRGTNDYSKLWAAIAELNTKLGLPDRGHLEQIVSRSRAFLTQYQSRFELLAGQTGALFFLNGKLVGVEIAPSSLYFQEVWMALVCFCYGVAAMAIEPKQAPAIEPFQATNLIELRQQLTQSRLAKKTQVQAWLKATPTDKLELTEEERFLNLRLHTASNSAFAGQLVEDHEKGQLIYASLFAKPAYLYTT